MAKKKKRGGKQGAFSKALNVGLTLLAISKAISIWLAPGFGSQAITIKAANTIRAYTGFGADGSFDPKRLLEGWLPAAGAFGLGFLLKFIRKKFPVR